jgi:tRNA(Ile)-lysidine synthase
MVFLAEWEIAFAPLPVNARIDTVNVSWSSSILRVASMSVLAEVVRRSRPELGGPGVVAVSGGADSVALLRILAAWMQPLVVAHLNHRLRGDDSDADEKFVRALAESLGLACRSIAIDVAEAARESRDNLEETARQRRYEFLASVANETGAAWVATGHTADDQAETVLHRLVRGAGIQGLRGIARERELCPSILLIRPLLDVTRGDVVAYLREIDQTWREDLSNRDPAFTRNRIRHELLPLLRTFNPAIVDVLGRLAEQAGEIHGDVELGAAALLQQAELPAAGPLKIFRADHLESASRHRVRAMFRILWDREGWPFDDMTFEHWKRVVAVALGEETASDLPGGVSARRKGGVVQVGKSAATKN